MALVTKADFARQCKVTAQAIGHAVRRGGPLENAHLDGKIETQHPDAVVYRSKTLARASEQAGHFDKTSVPSGIDDDGTPEMVEQLKALTLGEIERRFGGRPELEAWLKTIKLAEEVREKRLKNGELDGSLIPRDYVEKHIFGLLEEEHIRLLGETPRTLAQSIRTHGVAGITLEVSELEVRQIIAKILNACRDKVRRNLRGV